MSLFFFDTFGGLRALLYPPTMSCGSRIYRLRRDGRRKAEMTEDVDRHVLSHGHTDASLAETVAALHRRLRVAGDRPDATVLELLDLVDALASFPFGRFLLQNRGWNDFWTDCDDASGARPVDRHCPRRSALDSLGAATAGHLPDGAGDAAALPSFRPGYPGAHPGQRSARVMSLGNDARSPRPRLPRP